MIQYPPLASTTSKNIILRSRGTGNGINEAFFNIYIEDDTPADSPVQTTAFRGDPKWYTYPLSAGRGG